MQKKRKRGRPFKPEADKFLEIVSMGLTETQMSRLKEYSQLTEKSNPTAAARELLLKALEVNLAKVHKAIARKKKLP